MRFAFAAVMFVAAGMAQAASIPMYDLPIKNGEPGAVYKMSEHPNAVFVFEAYRNFCGACNDNAPAVDALADHYSSNDRVQVLDLSLDTSAQDFASWINRHKPNHPVVQDVGFKIFKALKTANSIPQVFVVNCRGEKVDGAVGTWSSSVAARLRASIDRALDTTCVE